MISYEENEIRKAQGKLFVDTPKGMIKAMCTKTMVDIFNHSWSINILKRTLLEKQIFKSFGKSWIEPPFHISVGKNTSAGSVVTKNIPANVVAMGIPCKVVREIGENDKIYYYKDRKIE